MKKQDFIKKLADALKVDAKILATELQKDEDIKLELPKLNAFTDEELATRDSNIKKGSYDEGVTVGFDKSAKKLKEVSGVEVEGLDIAKISNAIIAKANLEAKAEPSAKINELKDSISRLQTTVTEKESKIKEVELNFNNFKSESQILSEIPPNNAGLSNKTVLTEMRSSGFDFTSDGVTKNGELLKDNLQNPLNRIDVFNQFLAEKKWIKADKEGRGGGDESGSGGTPLNHEQFLNQCKADGINPAGEIAMAKAQELAKANPEFYN